MPGVVFAAGLCHRGGNALPAPFREPSVQDGDQFRLTLDIQLFGEIECFGKCCWLTHCRTQGRASWPT